MKFLFSFTNFIAALVIVYFNNLLHPSRVDIIEEFDSLGSHTIPNSQPVRDCINLLKYHNFASTIYNQDY
jgi:hypothetical protein